MFDGEGPGLICLDIPATDVACPRFPVNYAQRLHVQRSMQFGSYQLRHFLQCVDGVHLLDQAKQNLFAIVRLAKETPVDG